ncbi:hypothetical protein CAPTEDRAFT_213581 [Capitella teleta]|uniref:Uncharacterized protein n=1 Tax=Capitella teleta TaxID=283909 RepID=R7VCS9_CAPTE|nr:hypothetical protein CAPTEDRAFT_213581 [Capitella teleta]|eukprot:ELU16367.1 hypothetical protein CAPTEDRAFT_213581 [Capitella teleta]
MGWSVPISALVAFLCVASGNAEERISIQYTAENLITGDNRVFKATLQLETEKMPLHDIMFEAAHIDSRFEFRTAHHEDFGHYVVEMNNLPEDLAMERFWTLLKRDHPDVPQSDCALSHAGISTYQPFDGEHLVFAYETSDIFERIPECPILHS